MVLRHSRSEPNKGQQRIWQPVFPRHTLNDIAATRMKIEPDEQQLIDAKTGDEIGLKALCSQALSRDIEIALKESNGPTPFPFGEQLIGFAMIDFHDWMTTLHSRTRFGPALTRDRPIKGYSRVE